MTDFENHVPLVAEAFYAGDVERTKQLLIQYPETQKDQDGFDIWLVNAATRGNLPMIQMLVELGLDVNRSNRTTSAIAIAAAKNYLQVVRWLFDHGAHVNKTNKRGEAYSSGLSSAVIKGHFEMVKFFVEHGANVHSEANGVNALMHATTYGHAEIADYLRAHGAVDLRETTPPDFAATHQVVIDFLVNNRGPLGDWQLTIAGDPQVTIHVIPANDECPEVHTLFTTGLSDHRLPSAQDAYAATELRMLLPADWPLTEEALNDPRYAWPITGLRQVIEQLRSWERMPEMPGLFYDGGPPAPLHSGTRLSCWLLLKSDDTLQVAADRRFVDIHDLFAIYPEELDYVREHGHEALVEKFSEEEIPLYVSPQRKNVG